MNLTITVPKSFVFAKSSKGRCIYEKGLITTLCVFILLMIFIFSFLYIQNKSKEYIKGYQPSQIKQAYGFSHLNTTGKDQKIAIVIPYGSPTITEDLEIFKKQFDLIDPVELYIFYPSGKPEKQIYGWAQETSLDVEWVHALAPEASIFLIIAKTDSINDLLAAIDYTTSINADIVSISWTINEFKEKVQYESRFDKQNTIFIAPTGDGGAGTNWPAVSPNVLAVGGTTFSLDSEGNLITTETAWSESGGGISEFFTQPKYQKDYGINSNGYRAIPDVSFFSDSLKGVAIYCSPQYEDINGWTILAGTSLGVPAWAAYLALINENNESTVSTNIHEKLYKLAQDKGQYSAVFYDITEGENNKYKANKGYDYVTGLGSPRGEILYEYLANIPKN